MLRRLTSLSLRERAGVRALARVTVPNPLFLRTFVIRDATMPLPPRDIPVIRTRLAQTVFFFRESPKLTNPQTQTRSPTLAPAGAMVLESPTTTGDPEVFRPTTLQRQLLVDEVANKRERILEAQGVLTPTKTLLLAGGKILAAHLDDSDWDGLSAYHSQGLVDPYDVPGHDTWLHLHRAPDRNTDTLLAWIPREFLDHAESAIWSNPRKCLEWFNEATLR